MNKAGDRKAKRDIALQKFFLKVQALINEMEEKYPELRELRIRYDFQAKSEIQKGIR